MRKITPLVVTAVVLTLALGYVMVGFSAPTPITSAPETRAITIAPSGGPLIMPQAFVPMTMHETGKSFWTSHATRVDLIGDRHAYFNDEMHGQFLAMFFGHVKDGEGENEGMRIILALTRDGEAAPLETQSVSPVTSPKLPILVATHALKPGRYILYATLNDAEGKHVASVQCPIVREDKHDAHVAFPAEGIAINVHAQDHLPGATWPISTGVPMPKATVRDVSELALLENGQPVPAQFSVRATWSPKGFAKWVGVDFVARYDGNKPREYRLVRDAAKRTEPATPLKVEQADDKITVDTGSLRFEVGTKKFAGIEKAWINGQLVVDGPAGSYIVDQDGNRYTSADDAEVNVTLEDVGPLRATIAAKGWYTRADGEKLCLFIVRMTAHAGSPRLDVSHRTIITQTPLYGQEIYLADAGFDIIPAGGTSGWRFGADGESIDVGGAEAFLHQDRSDHFRLMVDGNPRREGKRTDGWFTATSGNGAAVTCYLRDAWQKFPVELELTGERMTVHLWPKHGHDVWTDEQEVARDQIYKVRFAHEGRLLNLWTPKKYIEKLREYEEQEHWAGGDAQLAIFNPRTFPDKTKIEAYDGQGVALSGEMTFAFTPAAPSPQDHAQMAGLFQQNPHGIADAGWNCATGVLGPVAARDTKKFPTAERLIDTGYNFYRRAIIDGADGYGKFIYGAVHNNWEAGPDHANLKRVWQMCHYQNVFQAWLLYFRSGLRDHLEWARIHSGQHIDVGVCNYNAFPKGRHSYAHIGNIPGAMYHCKGFVPWGGNAGNAGHWVDMTNYLMRYYLEGDRRGMDMVGDWMITANKMGTSNARVVPSTPDGYQTREVGQKVAEWRAANPDVKPADYPQWVKDENERPRLFNPREVFVPLGEVTHLYQATWDPQMIIYLQQFAEYLNLPFDQTNSPPLSAFGKHWQDWYYAFSRDQRVVTRVAEFMQSDYHTRDTPNYTTFAAFLYHNTGETKWLEPLVGDVYNQTLNIYDNPGDRWHHWSLAQNNPAAMFLGRLPMVLHAIDAAGYQLAAPLGEPTYAPSRGGRVDQADKWLVPPRGWSNTGVTILGYAPTPCQVAVSADGPMGYGSYRAFYKLYYDWPTLGTYPVGMDLKPWYEEQRNNVVTFSAENRFKDPPDQRNIGVGRGDDAQEFPYIELADNDPQRRFYRLEYGGTPPKLPALFNANSGKPLPQVAVISRAFYWNNQVKDAGFYVVGAINCYMRPLADNAVVELTVKSIERRYWMPTNVRVTDANGDLVAAASVFMAGERTTETITLDATKHPLPWRFEAVSSGDCYVTFTGADELFFAQSEADLDTILPKLEMAK